MDIRDVWLCVCIRGGGSMLGLVSCVYLVSTD